MVRVHAYYLILLIWLVPFAVPAQAPDPVQPAADAEPSEKPAAKPTAKAGEPDAIRFKIDAKKFEGTHAGSVVGSGGVVIRYGDLELRADKIEIHMRSKEFKASGGVFIKRGTMEWKGDNFIGNLKTDTFQLNDHAIKKEPWYLSAGNGRRDRAGVMYLDDPRMSTCDHLWTGLWPHWQMHAEDLAVAPDDTFTGTNVLFSVMGVPILYFPKLYGTTDLPEIEFRQGMESDWGYWFHLGKRFRFADDKYRIKPFIESREKRGVALGVEQELRTSRLSIDTLFYGMYDHNPLDDDELDDLDTNGRYETRENRFRVRAITKYTPSRNWSILSRFDRQSDNDMLFEFFRSEYNANPEPSSYLDFGYLRDGYEFSVNYRPRVNDHNTAVERQPELRFEVPRQEIGTSSIHYSGITTAGEYRANFREYDLERNSGDPDQSDYAAFRGDTTHVFYRPTRLDWLNIVPRIGVKGTYYSRSSESPVTDDEIVENLRADERRGGTGNNITITDYDAEGGERVRWAVESGLEMGFKAHRTWRDYKNEKLNINGLRHVLAPYINYTHIAEPSEDKDRLYFFDEIDRLDDVNFIRFGLRQELQTRREKGGKFQTGTLLGWESFIDYFFEPERGRPEAGDFGNVLTLDPHPAFNTTIKALIDSRDGHLNLLNARLRLGATDKLNTTVSYLFQDDYSERYVYSFGSDLTRVFTSGVFPQTLQKNHSLRVGLNVPLGDEIKFTASLYYDLDDEDGDKELATQRYSLSKRLHCWVGQIGYRRNEDVDTLELTFYLAALPGARFAYEQETREADPADLE